MRPPSENLRSKLNTFHSTSVGGRLVGLLKKISYSIFSRRSCESRRVNSSSVVTGISMHSLVTEMPGGEIPDGHGRASYGGNCCESLVVRKPFPRWNRPARLTTSNAALFRDISGLLAANHECAGLECRELLACVRRHFLDHGEDKLAVAVVQVGGVAADLAEKADFIVGKLGQPLGAVVMPRFREELRKRQFHRPGNLRERVERRDGVSVFDARQVAAQQPGPFLDVALRHTFLKPVVPDGLADIHGREHFRMRNGNQSGNFWQVGNLD